MQNYTDILESMSLRASLPLLLNNDKTAMTNSSGAAYPLTVVEDGRSCYRTDQHKLYVYSDGQWRLIFDFSKSPIFAQDVAANYATVNHNHNAVYAQKNIDEIFSKSLTVGANLSVTGTIFNASDRRLKHNIVAIEDALFTLKQLRGYHYRLNSTKRACHGLIAQEVQKAMPNAVSQFVDEHGDTFLTVNYNAVTAYLVTAVNQLAEKIGQLQTETFKK